MNTHVQKIIEVLGGTQAKAAESMGVTQAYLSFLLNDVFPITPEFAVKAEIATKGIVKRADLLPEIFGELDYYQEAA